MKIIDLTHPLSNGMPTYPSDPEVSVIKKKEICLDRSVLHEFTMGTHTGTHLDVPAHIFTGGKTLSDFPVDTFMGRAVKVDKKTYLKIEDVKENIEVIIYDTGWYKHFSESTKFYGPDRPNIPRQLIMLGITLGIKIFGCDLPSVDASGLIDKPVHHAFLEADIIVYESLNNLHQLPLLTPFDFYGFPLPFIGLDGSPVRAVGII